MPTNLAIDDQLLTKAVELGGLRGKKDAVTKALEEFSYTSKAGIFP